VVNFKKLYPSVDLYKCPACDCLPVRYRTKGNRKPICIRCNRELIRVSKLKKGYLLAAGLAGGGMALITLPDFLNHYSNTLGDGKIVISQQGSSPSVASKTRLASTYTTNDLLTKLEKADQQWRPQEEILADGSIRYLYKRREGEPDLTVAELQRLVESPPTFVQEREEIRGLLQALRNAGAKVLIEPTLKKGAAAEWDHSATTLRIQPKIIDKGSVDFLRVLSHEAIHVAQSCKAGSLQAKPEALGINVAGSSSILAKLNDPVYSKASQWEQLLEKEAYAAQDYPSIAAYHLNQECLSV
jgi:hypothetical protein